MTYDYDPIPALKQQLARELVRFAEGRLAWNGAVLIGTDQPRISDLRKRMISSPPVSTWQDGWTARCPAIHPVLYAVLTNHVHAR
jgi:hypothetical protein